MEIEEKVKLFQGKLDNFFDKKAAEKSISKESLKIIVSFRAEDPGKLKYRICDLNNANYGEVELKDIIHLSFLEKFATSHENIQNGLINHMEKFATDLLWTKQEISLQIKSTHEYSVLKNRAKFKDILLNEIL